MSQSYALTEAGLKIRNSRNVRAREFVCFKSINPLAQALSDCIVTGPGLIPGISAAGMCLQAQTYAATSTPETFYYTLQEAVLALKAARNYSLPMSRTVTAISRLISDLVSRQASPQTCCKALLSLHDALCAAIDKDESELRRSIEATLPPTGSIVSVGGFGSQHSVAQGTLVPVLIKLKKAAKFVPFVYSPTAAPLTETYYSIEQLQAAGCPCELVTDASLPSQMLRQSVNAVYVMAVRVCANGDVVCPAGSTGAVAVAKLLGVPVYAIAYRHCFDSTYVAGSEVPVEEYVRPELGDKPSVAVRQPFVNFLPHDWITSFVTGEGLIAPSESERLKAFTDTAQTALLSALEPCCRLA